MDMCTGGCPADPPVLLREQRGAKVKRFGNGVNWEYSPSLPRHLGPCGRVGQLPSWRSSRLEAPRARSDTSKRCTSMYQSSTLQVWQLCQRTRRISSAPSLPLMRRGGSTPGRTGGCTSRRNRIANMWTSLVVDTSTHEQRLSCAQP